MQFVLALTMAATASATPVEGPAGEAFYTPPSSTPAGSAGELVWYRPATVNLQVPLPANKAWTVLYQSTGQRGEPDFVTGTVIVPSSKWSGKGSRPVVTVGIGTQGIASKCAPSKQVVNGTEYDGSANHRLAEGRLRGRPDRLPGLYQRRDPDLHGGQGRGPGGARHRARRHGSSRARG